MKLRTRQINTIHPAILLFDTCIKKFGIRIWLENEFLKSSQLTLGLKGNIS